LYIIDSGDGMTQAVIEEHWMEKWSITKTSIAIKTYYIVRTSNMNIVEPIPLLLWCGYSIGSYYDVVTALGVIMMWLQYRELLWCGYSIWSYYDVVTVHNNSLYCNHIIIAPYTVTTS
jgi:hypothetical protein